MFGKLFELVIFELVSLKPVGASVFFIWKSQKK